MTKRNGKVKEPIGDVGIKLTSVELIAVQTCITNVGQARERLASVLKEIGAAEDTNYRLSPEGILVPAEA
jgi:hypothetical protein